MLNLEGHVGFTTVLLNQNLVDNVEDILSSSSLKLSLFPPWVLLQENLRKFHRATTMKNNKFFKEKL